jgi:hypothetical protein
MNNYAISVRHELNCTIPCLKVETIDHSEKGYLVPFRAYRFQVCATTEGDGDLGSSDVKQFREVITWMPETAFIDWLREQAMIAIMRWQPDHYRYGFTMTDGEIEIFEAFLKETYDWVKSL